MIACAFLLCLWRCSFGFSDDEPFYYTIPLRLIQGDALIFDEWNVSQLSSLFLIPFVRLFLLISGNTEGIMLAGRCFYLVMHFAVSLFICYKLRKYGPVSCFISVSYALFAPHEIMAYYYNTMAMDALVLSGLFLTENAQGNIRRVDAYISGLFFAVCVLCCPYMLAAYIFLFLFTVCYGRKKADKFFGAEVLIFFTLGAATLAVVLICFIFGRAGLRDIISSLPYIFNDPEHPPLSMWDRGVTIFFSIWRCHPLFHYALIAFAGEVAAIILDRRRKHHKSYYLIFSLLITAFCYCIFAPLVRTKYYNAIMLPLVFPGFISFILCENKFNRAFICFYIYGLIYALCLCFSSNLFFLVIPQAISISNISSILFIFELVCEMRSGSAAAGKHELGLCSAVFATVLCMLLSLQFYVKYQHSYYQFEKTSDLHYYIDKGPAKGTYTDELKYSEYISMLKDIEYYASADGQIAYLTVHPWCYLYTPGLKNGTYSAWLSGETKNTLDRLDAYWTINPGKIPQYVYMPKSAYFGEDDFRKLMRERGYNVSETETAFYAELII